MRKSTRILTSILSVALLASTACANVAAAEVTEPVVTVINAEQAADAVMSEGVVAENAVIDKCATDNQIASFAVPEDMGLPFNEGIFLTTGKASAVFESACAATSSNGNGDADLTEIYHSLGFTGSTYDAVKMSFDLVPTANDLSFEYFFASTEYDQNIKYNDVFALWIVDSETGEKFNVAKTPFGKIVNVDNTVTKDSNGNRVYTESSKYYKYVEGFKLNGYAFGVQGVTTKFSADASDLVNSKGNKVVQAGKPVKVSFAIADCGDQTRDSIIFVRGESLNYTAVEKKEFNVTFNANGGTCEVETAKTGTDGTLEILPEAVNGELVFDGWYTKPSGGEKVDVTTVFEKETTVYAHWKAQSYTITFDVNGGNAIGNMVYTNESTDVLPTAVKDGYNFTGWTVVAGDGSWELESVVEAGKSVQGMTGNVTLKANWEEIPTVPATEPTTEPETEATTEPTTEPTTNAATNDEPVNDNAVQTGAASNAGVMAAIMLAGAGIVAVAYRKKVSE